MPSEYQYIMAARRLWEQEGECEVDEPPVPDVSKVVHSLWDSITDNEDGAYVAAWVWVPKEEADAEEPEQA